MGGLKSTAEGAASTGNGNDSSKINPRHIGVGDGAWGG